MESDTPATGQTYRHYKGGGYIVQGIALHTETNQLMVVYRSLQHGTLWVRPRMDWMEPVERYPDVKRFKVAALCLKCGEECDGRCYA